MAAAMFKTTFSYISAVTFMLSCTTIQLFWPEPDHNRLTLAQPVTFLNPQLGLRLSMGRKVAEHP